MRRHRLYAAIIGGALSLLAAPTQAKGRDGEVKLDGYAEFREGDALLIDGQRVWADGKTKLKGNKKVFSGITGFSCCVIEYLLELAFEYSICCFNFLFLAQLDCV